MRLGAYQLDVYCDGGAHKWGQPYVQADGTAWVTVAGRNLAQVIRELRRAGWQLGKYDLCPACVAAREKPTAHWGEA